MDCEVERGERAKGKENLIPVPGIIFFILSVLRRNNDDGLAAVKSQQKKRNQLYNKNK